MPGGQLQAGNIRSQRIMLSDNSTVSMSSVRVPTRSLSGR